MSTYSNEEMLDFYQQEVEALTLEIGDLEVELNTVKELLQHVPYSEVQKAGMLRIVLERSNTLEKKYQEIFYNNQLAQVYKQLAEDEARVVH